MLSLDYVWSSALKDIRTVVTDPDDTPRALSSLSSLKLKRRAMLAARIERYWGQPEVVVSESDIRAMPVTGYGMSSVVEARLVKGGKWIVLLFDDGMLRLQSAKTRGWCAEARSSRGSGCAEDLSFVTPADSEVEMTLSLTAGPHKETLVLLRRSLWDVVYVCSALSISRVADPESPTA